MHHVFQLIIMLYDKMGATEALLGATILALVEVFTGFKEWIVSSLSKQVGKVKMLDFMNDEGFFKFLVELVFYMIVYSISTIGSY